MAKGRFHPRLLCNFDQTWNLNAIPRRKVLQVAQRVHEPLPKQRVRRRLEQALGLEHSDHEELVKAHDKHKLCEIQGGFAANTAIEGWRVPHTLTTLSWVDGFVGRGFVTARADHLGAASREKLNKDRHGNMFSF